jgi:hypothetical protein
MRRAARLSLVAVLSALVLAATGERLERFRSTDRRGGRYDDDDDD